MKFFVTGASGFVGHHLIQHLSSNHNIVGIGRRIIELPNCNYHSIENITDYGDFSTLLDGCDVVIHLAARVHVMHEYLLDPLNEFMRVNCYATIKLANEAVRAGVKRFIYVSTVKVNGESTKFMPFSELDFPNPHDPYAISKWQAEQALLKISQDTEMEVVIVRPPIIYGPGVKANFVSLLNVINKCIPLPLSSIHNRRSMIYVGNLVDALVNCATHPNAANKTYLVSDNEDLSTPQLIQKISECMKRPNFSFPFPVTWLHYAASLFGKKSVTNRLTESLEIDPSAILNDLSWTPPYNVHEGLNETIKWFFFNKSNNK